MKKKQKNTPTAEDTREAAESTSVVAASEDPDRTYIPEDTLSDRFFGEGLSQFQSEAFEKVMAEDGSDVSIPASASPSAGNAPAEAPSEGEPPTEDASTGVAPEESAPEDTEPPSTPHAPRKKSKKPLIALGTVCGILLLTVLGLFGYLYIGTASVTVDLDEAVSIAPFDNGFWSLLCSPDTDPAALDTSHMGDKTLPLTLFGFIGRDMTVRIADLTPPTLVLHDLTVHGGAAVTARDLVSSCEDKTAVTYGFVSNPPKATGPVTVFAVDEGGNTTEGQATVTFSDRAPLTVEYGTDAVGLQALLAEAYPDVTVDDTEGVDLTLCGAYRLTGEEAGIPCALAVTVADTLAPTGNACRIDVPKGTPLIPEDFVSDIKDASEVTLAYKVAPDENCFTPQSPIVTATDAAGNVTEFTASLRIWDIPSVYPIECGTATKTMFDGLFAALDAGDRPVSVIPVNAAALKPGTHALMLSGTYGTFSVSLEASDTVAPVLTLQPVTAYIGHLPEAKAFCASIADATGVTVTYEAEPDVSEAHTVTVPLLAVDAGGNETRARGTLTVIPDTEPPVFSGVYTLYVKEGETVSYRKNVKATDNADGDVRVTVDASRVNVNVCGTYYVTYSAVDSAGNEAKATARVIVSGVNQTSVDAYCDEILRYIVTKNMTPRAKAEAIYNWCVKNIRYTTATSHLMGQFVPAAYSGLTTHGGNCYTYYAVASALLTRAGIENQMIYRNSVKSPHYWNLIKIGGAWYHMDTCPQPKKNEARIFMKTDADLAAYNRREIAGYYSFDRTLFPATP